MSTTRHPEYVPHRYTPETEEPERIAAAIRLFRHLIIDDIATREGWNDSTSVDARWIMGWVECAAAEAAAYRYKAADSRLWSDIAVVHPWHRSGDYQLRLVWVDYIRTAGTHLAEGDRHVA